MNNKRNLGAVLAFSAILTSYSIYTADQEQKAGFLPKINQATSRAGLKEVSGPPECALRVPQLGMPSIKLQNRFMQPPLGRISVERRPLRYDGFLQSPVLSSAGSIVLESSPTSSYAGVRLSPFASSASISTARL